MHNKYEESFKLYSQADRDLFAASIVHKSGLGTNDIFSRGGKNALTAVSEFFLGEDLLKLAYPASLDIAHQYTSIRKSSAVFGGILSLNNNFMFIRDELEKGGAYTDIIRNLNKVENDPEAHEFSKSNPEKLGYLICLQPNILDDLLRMMNSDEKWDKFHTDLIIRHPEEVAAIVRVRQENPQENIISRG